MSKYPAPQPLAPSAQPFIKRDQSSDTVSHACANTTTTAAHHNTRQTQAPVENDYAYIADFLPPPPAAPPSPKTLQRLRSQGQQLAKHCGAAGVTAQHSYRQTAAGVIELKTTAKYKPVVAGRGFQPVAAVTGGDSDQRKSL